MNVFWVVFALMMVSDWIREVFENPKASRIGMMVVGAAAMIATVLLVGILRDQDAGKDVDGLDEGVDRRIRSLKLS
jgi:Co/Zn/Cd efflux system component